MARLVSKQSGVMPGQHSFAKVPGAEMQRSVFNRSSGLKTAFDSGLLIPIFADEALPGDTMTLKTSSLVRMTTPIFPVMDNMWMDVFYFAVPNRLIWDNWQKFNGEQVDPGDSTDFLLPQFDAVALSEQSLSDYLGIPPVTGEGAPFCSMWHRAYNFIFNEWFRDENLQDSLVVDKGDGPDMLSNYQLVRRGKRHDYFTSCLPFTQKGDPVTMPLGTTAPVIRDPTQPIPEFSAGAVSNVPMQTDAGSNVVMPGAGADPTIGWGASNKTGLLTDLSTALGATINQIREAFQVQRLLERDARGGSRYTEIIRSHFGVVSPDQRLQRPEYLGGGTARINVNPVAVTADVAGANIGDLTAFATSSFDGVGFMKSFTEHCVILGLVSVRADLNYQQGINRMFSRRTRFDFYWPAFAHLGEQAVLNKEIFMDGSANDDLTFGFQERYAEYRYKPSMTTGRMRSSSVVPLDQWHLALDFSTLPLLNDTFIEENPPFARVIAVDTEPQFFGDFFFDFKCARPMPTFSVPGLIDHF